MAIPTNVLSRLMGGSSGGVGQGPPQAYPYGAPSYEMLDRLSQQHQNTPKKSNTVIPQRYQGGGVAYPRPIAIPRDYPDWSPSRQQTYDEMWNLGESMYRNPVRQVPGRQFNPRPLPYEPFLAQGGGVTTDDDRGGYYDGTGAGSSWGWDDSGTGAGSSWQGGGVAYQMNPSQQRLAYLRAMTAMRRPPTYQEGGIVDPETGRVVRNYATEGAGSYYYVDPRARESGQGYAATPRAGVAHGEEEATRNWILSMGLGPVHTLSDQAAEFPLPQSGIQYNPDTGTRSWNVGARTFMQGPEGKVTSFLSMPPYREPTEEDLYPPEGSGVQFRQGGVADLPHFWGGGILAGNPDYWAERFGFDMPPGGNLFYGLAGNPHWGDLSPRPDVWNPNASPPSLPDISREGPDINLIGKGNIHTPAKVNQARGGVIREMQGGGVAYPGVTVDPQTGLPSLGSSQAPQQQASPAAGEPSKKKQPQPQSQGPRRYEFGPADYYYTAPLLRTLMEMRRRTQQQPNPPMPS